VRGFYGLETVGHSAQSYGLDFATLALGYLFDLFSYFA
jgi:hypothetical protein